MADVENEQKTDSNAGRPLLFESVEELDQAIEAYFGEQSPHVSTRKKHVMKNDGSYFWQDEQYMTEQQPVTMHGLARALNIDRRTLLNYKNRDEFFPSIQRALDRCAEYAETQLYVGNANGARFSLTNNFEWQEKQSVDHTSAGQPMKALVEIVPSGDAADSQD